MSESGSIEGHYTGKSDLELDSFSFLTLITNLQSHSAFGVGFLDTGFRQTRENRVRNLLSSSNSMTFKS